MFDCEHGKLHVGNVTIGDSKPHGRMSVADIIRVSSNIGAAKIGQKLGRKSLSSSIRAFGFAQKTPLDFPGETRGLLADAGTWSDVDQATIAFGQGISASPLQMTMAFAAIANGGLLLRPRLVKRGEITP